MKSESQTPAGKLAAEPYDFSLVLGGPLYQLFRRAHLSGDTLELLRRRVVVITLFAWLPLLALFVVAELVVHRDMRPVVRQFTERGLVTDEIRGKFEAALVSAQRLRNSVTAEVLMIALVYGVGVLFI